MGTPPPYPRKPRTPQELPISPYTGEHYDPAWGTVIQKGGGRELLHEDDPFALDKRLLGEPTYSHLIEDFMLALGTFLLTLWRALVGKRDSHVPLLPLPPQSITSDVPVALESGYTALEWINAQRAIHGYEPLLEEPQADHQEMQFAPADWRRA